MVFFVIGIILIIIAVIAVIAGVILDAKGVGIGVAFVAVVLAAFAIISQTFYTQDTGEASVLVDVSGQIAGQSTDPGFHGKAPWQSVHTFNIRNQKVSFLGDGKGGDDTGNVALGPSITGTDADGVASEIDVDVRYSLNPSKVTNIYRQYKDESNFVNNYVLGTIRSATRKVPNTYSTLDVITKQNQLQTDISSALERAFGDSGVRIDSVTLQNVNPPQAIKDARVAAQQAQIQVTAEKAKLQATQVSAQQQVVQAQAQAKANAELNKGLTKAVLQSRYIDALRDIGDKGNLVVVPQGSTPFINVGK
jgi:regulator of protease activity HflC (stomatin/prohibitin superfamily)